MLDHVTLSAADFAASERFYDAALGALGWVRLAELADEEEDDAAVEAVGWGAPDGSPQIWLVPGHRPTRELHISLSARSRLDVETFFSDAVHVGGGEVHAAPRRWTVYRRGQFNAIVADPDGNLVEAVGPE